VLLAYSTAELSVKGNRGRTPADWARHKGQAALLQLLEAQPAAAAMDDELRTTHAAEMATIRARLAGSLESLAAMQRALAAAEARVEQGGMDAQAEHAAAVAELESRLAAALAAAEQSGAREAVAAAQVAELEGRLAAATSSTTSGEKSVQQPATWELEPPPAAVEVERLRRRVEAVEAAAAEAASEQSRAHAGEVGELHAQLAAAVASGEARAEAATEEATAEAEQVGAVRAEMEALQRKHATAVAAQDSELRAARQAAAAASDLNVAHVGATAALKERFTAEAAAAAEAHAAQLACVSREEQRGRSRGRRCMRRRWRRCSSGWRH
jgi:hypothetical protein